MTQLNNGSRGTMQWHLYCAAAIAEALRGGAEIDGINANLRRLHRAYNAGEPVWMIAAELILVATDWTHAQQVAAGVDGERRVSAAAVRVLQ